MYLVPRILSGRSDKTLLEKMRVLFDSEIWNCRRWKLLYQTENIKYYLKIAIIYRSYNVSSSFNCRRCEVGYMDVVIYLTDERTKKVIYNYFKNGVF